MSGIVNLAADERPEDRYPECRNAVVFMERLFVSEPVWIPFLSFKTKRTSLDGALRSCQKKAFNECGGARDGCQEDCVSGQMDMPQFRTYLAAKLGLV